MLQKVSKPVKAKLRSGRPNELLVEKIRLDGDTQARVKLDDEAIADYAERMKAGDRFPRIVVFFDGEHHWLADGFHRVRAAISINKRAIKAEVIKGTREEAIWYALSANRKNGLRFSRADKANACKRALRLHPEHSDRLIAEHIGVEHHTVAARRRELLTAGELATTPARLGKDGNRYEPPPESRMKSEGGEFPHLRTTSYNLDFASKPDIPPTLMDDPPLSSDLPPVAEIDPIPVSTTPVDEIGQPIRDDVIAADFASGWLMDTATKIRNIRHEIIAACERDDRLTRFITATAIKVELDNAYHQLKGARPYCICPYCGGGANCKACKGNGWINQVTYDHAPKELKRGVA